MPTYNCELYVAAAIESILNQIFTDFEFLIIDDCSTDATLQIAQSYDDNRIKIITKEKNTGYTESLNYAISIAKGKYIARMDGDDISLPERLAEQIAFLDTHPDVILCGTLYQTLGTEKISRHPISYEEIKVKLISVCCIAHPTVVMRKNILDEYGISYDVAKEPAEDYDLWSRIIFLGKIVNINKVLLHYRMHPQQTSVVRSEKQGAVSREIRNRMLQKLDPDFHSEVFPSDVESKLDDAQFKVAELQEEFRKLDLLVHKNKEKQVYDVNLFSKFIHDEKYYICNVVNNKSERYSVQNLVGVMLYFPVFFSVSGMRKSIKFIGRNFFFKVKKQLSGR